MMGRTLSSQIFRPQLHDAGLLFISDCLAKSVITAMFDFVADFGTDVRNVSDSLSFISTSDILSIRDIQFKVNKVKIQFPDV